MVDPKQGKSVSGRPQIEGTLSEGVPEVNVDSLSNGPSESVPQSVTAALTSGYAVAVDAAEGAKSVDPSSYDTDDSAIQSLVNWLEWVGNGGSIYCPPRTPDGSQLTIENTVSMDPSLNVPINWYFFDHATSQGASNGTEITTTINDGSPMFDISGSVTDGRMIQSINFIGQSFDLDGNNASVARFRYVGNSQIKPGLIRSGAGDCLVIDSNCMDNVINNLSIFPSSTSARCVIFKNSEGSSTPGADHILGPFFKTDGNFHTAVENPGGHHRIRIGGKIEGGGGLATIVNQNGGSIYITPHTVLGNNSNGAHGMYLDDGFCYFGPSQVNLIDGDGIHAGGGSVRISQMTIYNAISGDSIFIDPDRAIDAHLPYETSISGTVTYPSLPWSDVYYNDGWQKYRGGTSTVPAGTSTEVTAYAGRDGTATTANVWVAENVNVSSYDVSWGHDADTGQHTLTITNEGINDAQFGYIIYRRGMGNLL